MVGGKISLSVTTAKLFLYLADIFAAMQNIHKAFMIIVRNFSNHISRSSKFARQFVIIPYNILRPLVSRVLLRGKKVVDKCTGI